MKKLILLTITAVALLGTGSLYAGDIEDGNVYFTDDEGVKHFICPVMGTDTVVEPNTTYSDVDGKRYYYCCPGCKSQFEADPASFISKMNLPGNVVKIDDQGTHIMCPVTGETALMTEDNGFSDYNGRRYYYCCPGCKEQFDKNPEKYLKSLEMKKGHGSGGHSGHCGGHSPMNYEDSCGGCGM